MPKDKSVYMGAWAIVWGLCLGCVGSVSEPKVVASVGAQNLRCPQSEVETALRRKSAQVREYYVGCDFMYTRVLCSGQGCYPAKPNPGCFSGGCFKENPVTFEWELDESLARADASDTSVLFR